MCFLFIGVWERISSLGQKHPILEPLTKELPEVILHSKANTTRKVYNRHFQHWKNWCHNLDIHFLTPDTEYILLYLMSIFQNAASFVTITHALSAIKWRFSLANISIKDTPVLTEFLESCKRLLAKPVHKKETITPDILSNLVKKYCSGTIKVLSDNRDVVMCLISFAGFLRFNEVVNIHDNTSQFMIHI